MDVVATVRSRLLLIDAVRALVSDRVYSQHAPQSPTRPAIVVLRVSEQSSGHLRGGENMRRSRVQVTSIGATRESAIAVDVAVQGNNDGTGLSYWRGSMGSPSVLIHLCAPADVQEFYDPGELRQYRINRDFIVWHS